MFIYMKEGYWEQAWLAVSRQSGKTQQVSTAQREIGSISRSDV